VGGGRGEASLPDGPALDLAHRQQAVGGDTLVGHDAKELAGRQAGVFHERLQVAALGQALTRLPGADGGNGNAQITGDSLEWNLVLPAPVAEGARKAGADVTMKIPLLGHGQSVREIRPGVKRAKGGARKGGDSTGKWGMGGRAASGSKRDLATHRIQRTERGLARQPLRGAVIQTAICPSVLNRRETQTAAPSETTRQAHK